MKREGLLLICMMFLLFACHTAKTTSTSKALSTIAGTAKVIAKVTKVYDDRSDVFPCSEVACMAYLKIEKVESKGGNFMKPLTAGQEGRTRFTFSLSETTEELFPNLDKRLPGLKKGDRIQVNVGEEQLLGSNETQWVAYDYILLN